MYWSMNLVLWAVAITRNVVLEVFIKYYIATCSDYYVL